MISTKLLKTEEYKFLKTNEHLGKHVILLGLSGSYSYVLGVYKVSEKRTFLNNISPETRIKPNFLEPSLSPNISQPNSKIKRLKQH